MAKHPSEMISAALKRKLIQHTIDRGATHTTIRIPFSNLDNLRNTDFLRQDLGIEHRPEQRNFVPGIYHRFLDSIRGLPKTHGITVQHGPAGRLFVESELRIRMRNKPLARPARLTK